MRMKRWLRPGWVGQVLTRFAVRALPRADRSRDKLLLVEHIQLVVDSGDDRVLVRALGKLFYNAQPVQFPIALCHMFFLERAEQLVRPARASRSGRV